MPKKSKAPRVVAIVAGLVVLGLLVWGGLTLLKGCTTPTLAAGQTAELTIDEGTGAKAIGAQLQEAGVIANANDFVGRVTETGADASLKPGKYVFSGGMALDDVIGQITAGPNATTYTIPEGYTLQKTAAKVAEAYPGKISAADFLAAANNAQAYAADFPFVAGAYNNSLEGFLFPKTYEVESDATADSVVRQMLTQFETETAGLDFGFAQSRGLNEAAVVNLASIIEKEATDDNRAKVSSVFYNRLAADMALQSDATTAYAVGHDPTPDDLKVEGPYNTYLNKGLPAGPICSPGLASLKAACSPEGTNYLYFYFKEVDGKMQYFFSENYDEHLAAIDS